MSYGFFHARHRHTLLRKSLGIFCLKDHSNDKYQETVAELHYQMSVVRPRKNIRWEPNEWKKRCTRTPINHYAHTCLYMFRDQDDSYDNTKFSSAAS